MNPNGLRVGTPAMTSRGLMEEDFVKIGQSLGSDRSDRSEQVAKHHGVGVRVVNVYMTMENQRKSPFLIDSFIDKSSANGDFQCVSLPQGMAI